MIYHQCKIFQHGSMLLVHVKRARGKMPSDLCSVFYQHDKFRSPCCTLHLGRDEIILMSYRWPQQWKRKKKRKKKHISLFNMCHIQASFLSFSSLTLFVWSVCFPFSCSLLSLCMSCLCFLPPPYVSLNSCLWICIIFLLLMCMYIIFSLFTGIFAL